MQSFLALIVVSCQFDCDSKFNVYEVQLYQKRYATKDRQTHESGSDREGGPVVVVVALRKAG